jgi:hypothetical protein
MEPGDVLRRSWELYRAHWRHLVTIAAVVLVPLGAVTAPLALLGWPGIVGANVLDLSALFLVNGALVRAVEDVRDGRPDLSVADTFRHAGARLLVLAVAGVLAAVGIFVGLLLLVVPGLVLLTWWFVLSPVVILEGRGILPAFGRSRALVRGDAWPVFGVAIVTLLVELGVSLALGAAALPLGGPVSSFAQSAIGNSFVTPFVAVAATLTYFRLHDREAGVAPAPASHPAPSREH